MWAAFGGQLADFRALFSGEKWTKLGPDSRRSVEAVDKSGCWRPDGRFSGTFLGGNWTRLGPGSLRFVAAAVGRYPGRIWDTFFGGKVYQIGAWLLEVGRRGG